MKKKKNLFLKILISLVILTPILWGIYAVGDYMVSYSIGRAGDGGNRTVSLDVNATLSENEQIIANNKKLQKKRNKQFKKNTTITPVKITADDGIQLAGSYVENDSHKWVIIIHGYRSSKDGMMGFIERYYNTGYQVLAPDLRACGESEGDYIGMGWLDAKDLLLWIDWILQKDKDAAIVLHGVSMGAAATMMVAGEQTPDAVKVFVEDCGYTSVWDIFSSELKLRFHLPKFPVMYSASLVAKVRAGYSFQEASALKQVKKCEKPMLFIHGTEDSFIPFYMEQTLYDAKPGTNKEIIAVEGADHCRSAYLLGENYWEQVFDFIDTYLE